MFQELFHHKIAYIFLLLILVGHVVLFFYFWPSRAGMRIVVASLISLYFFWGVLTHVKTNTITRKVVREYFFAALLAGVILMLLTV